MEQIEKISDGENPESIYVSHHDDPVPGTKSSAYINSDSLMLHQIEENFSEALANLNYSQEQFMQNQVISVITKQAEILNDHKKVLDSVCSKLFFYGICLLIAPVPVHCLSFTGFAF